MKRALVLGDSGGIGAAIRACLKADGWEVTGLSRRADGFDVTSEASVESHLGRLAPGFDLIFVATGALGTPEKALSQLSVEELQAQFLVNAVGPALILKHAARLLPRDRPAHFAALSARVGSIGDNGLGGWYSYRTAKAALNQLLHTAAIELKRKYPQLVVACLHPGTVETEFTRDYPREKLAPEVAARALLEVLLALGPAQSGQFFDYKGKPVPW
jgi:NAD(P)-dependent dehydrogenase (short-subunit alcohol dehydrogenase family)